MTGGANLCLLISMVLFGIWHKATILFVLFGCYHGVLLILHRQGAAGGAKLGLAAIVEALDGALLGR